MSSRSKIIILIIFIILFSGFLTVGANNVVTISFDPSEIDDPSLEEGDQFNTLIKFEDAVDLQFSKLRLKWDPYVIKYVEANAHPDFGGAIALTGGLNQTKGEIELSNCRFNGFTGDCRWYTVTWEIVGGGTTNITIFDVELGDTAEPRPNPIQSLVSGPCIVTSYAPVIVQVKNPEAKFSPEDGSTYLNGSNIELDASSSVSGYDSLPSGETVPITEYKWEIDTDADGTKETILYGLKTSFQANVTGNIAVTLTVSAPDVNPPTSTEYDGTDSATKMYIITPTSGGNGDDNITLVDGNQSFAVDVYTERGGKGYGKISLPYGPQELVEIYASIEYHNAVQEGMNVAFTIKDSKDQVINSRSAFTDAQGIAKIDYRMPWPDQQPESMFGKWKIVANINFNNTVYQDILQFDYDYIVEIQEVKITNQLGLTQSSFNKLDHFQTRIECVNRREVTLDTLFSFSVFDSNNVPIITDYMYITVLSNSSQTIRFDSQIPSWALSGNYEIYINVFTINGDTIGLPFCPEVLETISIN